MEMSNGLTSTVTSGAGGEFSFANAIKDMYFTWRLSKPGYVDASMRLVATASNQIEGFLFQTLSDAPIAANSDLEYAVGANVSRFNVNLDSYSGPVIRSNSSYSFLLSDRADDPNNQIAFIGGSGRAEAGDVERLNAALRDPTVSTIYIYKSIIGVSPQELFIPTRPVKITSDSDFFIQAELATNNMLTWATNVRQIGYGDVFGFVKGEDNERVFGATVTLGGVTTETTITDINGYYHFRNLSMGTYVLSAYRSSDYGTQIYPIPVDNSSPEFHNFVLERSAQYMATNMIISNPSVGQTQLTLPDVPDGYTVSIDSSSDISKISLLGIVLPSLFPQEVSIIYKVTHGVDVGYRSASITVPGLL